jgi:hypothetical protein
MTNTCSLVASPQWTEGSTCAAVGCGGTSTTGSGTTTTGSGTTTTGGGTTTTGSGTTTTGSGTTTTVTPRGACCKVGSGHICYENMSEPPCNALNYTWLGVGTTCDDDCFGTTTTGSGTTTTSGGTTTTGSGTTTTGSGTTTTSGGTTTTIGEIGTCCEEDYMSGEWSCWEIDEETCLDPGNTNNTHWAMTEGGCPAESTAGPCPLPTTTTTIPPQGACCYYEFSYSCVQTDSTSCSQTGGYISWTDGVTCPSSTECPVATTTAAPTTTTTAAPTTTTADYCLSTYSVLQCGKCLGLGRSQDGGCAQMNINYGTICEGTWSGHANYNHNPCRPFGSNKSEFPP